MQNAAGYGAAPTPQEQNDAYRAVVSDLVSMAERVQISLRLVEQVIAKETLPETSPETSSVSPESSTHIIVLDGVSPRYMKAGAALQACHVNIGILRSLLDAGDSESCSASLPARSVIGAYADAAPLPGACNILAANSALALHARSAGRNRSRITGTWWRALPARRRTSSASAESAGAVFPPMELKPGRRDAPGNAERSNSVRRFLGL
jgi:hypothetical protein